MYCILFFFILIVAKSQYIGIDLGTKFSKTTYIDRGEKVEIVENEDNRRKDPTLLAIHHNHRRMFGNQAQRYAKTKPERVLQYGNKLIGKLYNDELVKYIQSFALNEIVEEETNKNPIPLFKLDNLTFPPEEIVSNMIRRNLINAQKQSQKTINDTVFSISPYATPLERYALVHSANLVGVRTKSLIHSPLAFAATLAKNQDLFDIPTNVLIIDIGDLSVEMGLFTFSKKQSIGSIETQGYFSSNTFGGHNFDRILEQMIMNKLKMEIPDYTDKYDGKDIWNQIHRKAEKQKKILSVNKEVTVVVELNNETEWKTNITLDEFEKESKEEMKKFEKILSNAMKQLKIKKQQIGNVQLVGGSMRIPMILNSLNTFFGEDKIHRNIDAEEGAATGLGYHAIMQIPNNFLKKEYKFKDFMPIKWFVSFDNGKEQLLFDSQYYDIPEMTVSYDKLDIENLDKFTVTVYYQMNHNNDEVNNQKERYMLLKLTKYAQKKLKEKYDELKKSGEKSISLQFVFRLNNHGLVEHISTKMNSHKLLEVQFDEYYHGYISKLSKRSKKIKEMMKYYDKNEEIFSKLIDSTVSFESILDQLKSEIESKGEEFENKEQYLKQIQENKDWLELVDLDTITKKDIIKRLNTFTQLSYILHPEFKEQSKQMKKQQEQKKQTNEFESMINHLKEVTKKYNFIKNTIGKLQSELINQNTISERKKHLDELRRIQKYFKFDEIYDDIRDIKELFDIKHVQNIDLEMKQIEKYIKYYDDLYTIVFKSSSSKKEL